MALYIDPTIGTWQVQLIRVPVDEQSPQFSCTFFFVFFGGNSSVVLSRGN